LFSSIEKKTIPEEVESLPEMVNGNGTHPEQVGFHLD